MAQTTENDTSSALLRLRSVVEVARDVDPEMPAQTLLALLEIANSPGTTMAELQRSMGLSSAAMSRIIKRLGPWKKVEPDGKGVPGPDFVKAERRPYDQRYVDVVLTTKGRGFVQRLANKMAA